MLKAKRTILLSQLLNAGLAELNVGIYFEVFFMGSCFDFQEFTGLLKKIEEEEVLIREKKIKKEKCLQPITDEEIPYCLSREWAWIRFGNLLSMFDYGSSEKSFYLTEGVPVVSMGNVSDGRIHFVNMKMLRDDSQDLPWLFLSKNDILFNRTNSARWDSHMRCWKKEQFPPNRECPIKLTPTV